VAGVRLLDHYVWLIWSCAFLVPWLGLFLWLPGYRWIMVWSSVATTPFGLTEPLFVPRYWNPPSLFNLAQRTGFDLESLIFCFAIGGVGVVVYDFVTSAGLKPVERCERTAHRHRYHRAALLAPVITFSILCGLPWNPIYPAIIALMVGGLATIACRPDLKLKTLIGGGLFAGYYAVFMLLLEWSAPGYIERVWNLPALSGVVLGGIPLEELLFGFAFGTYWSGIYEHLTWQRVVAPERATSPGYA
jgi:hypothetical protein